MTSMDAAKPIIKAPEVTFDAPSIICSTNSFAGCDYKADGDRHHDEQCRNFIDVPVVYKNAVDHDCKTTDKAQ